MGSRTLVLVAIGLTVAAATFLLRGTPDPSEGDGVGRRSAAADRRGPNPSLGELDSDARANPRGVAGGSAQQDREEVEAAAEATEPCRIEPLDGGPVHLADEGPVTVIARRAGRSHEFEVQDDGSFALPTSLRSRMTRFSIRSRYLRLEERAGAEEDGPIVLRPERGGCILVRPVGSPAAVDALDLTRDGQAITALSFTGGVASVQREAHMDADGQVLVGGLPEGTAWRIQLSSSDHVDARASAPMVKAGETTPIDIPLELGVAVAGVVKDMAGDPVPGAAVRLRSWRYHDESQAVGATVAGVTGPDGDFRLAGLRPGPVYVSANAEGYLRSEIDLGEQDSGAVLEDTLIRLKGGIALAGVVVWPDGSPAPEVAIQLRTIGGQFRQDAEATSDGEGRFEIKGLTGGPFELHGRVRKKREVFIATARADSGGGSVRLELGPGATCTGQVVDDRGEALPRFRISARALGLRAGLRSVESRVKEPDGTFTLAGLAPGNWEVTATAKDHGPCTPVRIVVPEGGKDVLLTLPREGSLSGFLHSDDGEALGDVRIAVGNSSATTGPDGAFVLEDLKPGLQRIRVAADGFGQPVSNPVVLAPGEVREGERVVVSRGASVIGVVHPSVHTGTEGNMTLRKNGTFDSDYAPLNEDGSFRFDGVREGRYWVNVSTAGKGDMVVKHRAGHMTPVDVPSTGTVEVVVGDPQGYPIHVTGVVTEDGEPMPGLLLYAYVAASPGVYPYALDRTDEEGRYDVSLREPGEYVFSVGKGQTQQSRNFVMVTEAPEQTVDFELPTLELRGRLLRANGEPVAREQVMLLHEDARPDTIRLGDMLFAWTRSDGTFVFKGLAAGRYRLRTTHYMRMGETTTLVIRGGIDVPWPEGTPELEVVLPAGAVVDVRALRTDGAPYPEGRIRLEDSRGYVAVIYDQRSPDADGVQRYVGISPGAWTAVVESPEGTEVGRATVVVDEGVDTEVIVRCGGD